MLMLGTGLFANAQKLAVKNNLLYDMTQTPNIGFEYAVSPKWTIGLNLGINTSWHHASGGSGFFFPFSKGSAHGEHDKVQWRHILISLKDHRRQGKAFGAGIFYGYSWILSPHWSIEAEGGIDVGIAHFKEYDCANCGVFQRKDTKPFIAPKIGINAVYNIK